MLKTAVALDADLLVKALVVSGAAMLLSVCAGASVGLFVRAFEMASG